MNQERVEAEFDAVERVDEGTAMEVVVGDRVDETPVVWIEEGIGDSPDKVTYDCQLYRRWSWERQFTDLCVAIRH